MTLQPTSATRSTQWHPNWLTVPNPVPGLICSEGAGRVASFPFWDQDILFDGDTATSGTKGVSSPPGHTSWSSNKSMSFLHLPLPILPVAGRPVIGKGSSRKQSVLSVEATVNKALDGVDRYAFITARDVRLDSYLQGTNESMDGKSDHGFINDPRQPTNEMRRYKDTMLPVPHRHSSRLRPTRAIQAETVLRPLLELSSRQSGKQNDRDCYEETYREAPRSRSGCVSRNPLWPPCYSPGSGSRTNATFSFTDIPADLELPATGREEMKHEVEPPVTSGASERVSIEPSVTSGAPREEYGLSSLSRVELWKRSMLSPLSRVEHWKGSTLSPRSRAEERAYDFLHELDNHFGDETRER